jgi:chemotaxis signal transduction protein
MTDYKSEEADDLFWVHSELGFGDKPVSYLSPVIVKIRTDNALSYRIIIDAVEEISLFSHDDIFAFPSLCEPFTLKKGMWGILKHKERMFLLVDFQLLLKNSPKINKTRRRSKCNCQQGSS